MNINDFTLKYILSIWKKGILPAFYFILATIISLVYPLISKTAIDEVILNKRHNLLIFLSLVFLILLIFQQIFSYLSEMFFFKFQQNSIFDIQKLVVNKMISYPINFFEKNHSGYLIGRIRGDIAGLTYVISESLLIWVIDFIKFIGAFFILFIMNKKLSLIAISIIPFIIYKNIKSKNRIISLNKRILEENSHLEKELSELFQGIEIYKSFANEEIGKSKALDAFKSYKDIEINRQNEILKFKNLINFLVHLGEIFLLYFGIKEVIIGNLSIGGYTAFIAYLIYLYSPIQNLSYMLIYLNYAKQSYLKIQELLNIKPESNGSIKIDKINQIIFDNMSFSFEDTKEIINNFNLVINQTDKIILVGRTGAGKSTLLKLLLGFYRPDKGNIRVNNIDISEIDKKSFREKIGFISQNIFLFNQSIKDNITFGANNISKENLNKFLKKCKMENWINNFKYGIDQMISEKGLNISGGERQKIAVLRALVKNPDILIIDEGTSNLDLNSEKEIMEIIKGEFKNKIIIRVTHRQIEYDNYWKSIPIFSNS
jgi:ABC-type bacteriocin/lantibiotic exporter with double-glycine peptidase domain